MAKYPSTQKSGKGSPEEIDAALFDLLAKINELAQATSGSTTSFFKKVTSAGQSYVDLPVDGRYMIDVTAGGASGGGADANAVSSVAGASGGGAGSHAVFLIDSPARRLYINVGDGGAAPSAGNNNGNNGGNSTVGITPGGSEFVSCQGGRAGIAAQAGATSVMIAALAAASVNSFGTEIVSALIVLDEQGQGSYNQTILTTFGIASFAAITPSMGGKSPYGPPPSLRIVTGASQVVAGTAGIGPGAGGGGATVRDSATDAAGAAGNAGQFLIRLL